MIGWSLSQAGAPEMGISEEGASSLLHGTALTDNTLVCLLFTAGRPPDTDDRMEVGERGEHGEQAVAWRAKSKGKRRRVWNI